MYGDEGWVEDWPSLSIGRYDHGCGHFVNTDNQVVRGGEYPVSTVSTMLQVYLVTGGGPEPYTASTELLVEGEAGWRLSGPLPRAVMGLRAASINNMVIATGEVIIIGEDCG